MTATLLYLVVGLASFEPVDFQPMTFSNTEWQTLDLFTSEHLERTPRDYARVTAFIKASGAAEAAIVLVDILNREYRGAIKNLPLKEESEISIDMEQMKHPISMLRAVQLYLKGGPVEVRKLRFLCGDEKLPKPDAVVQGPMDDTSIQSALNSLGQYGGIVYIPAGTYMINNQVVIPKDNITIYGDGSDTIIQGTWTKARGLLFAEGRKNLRLTRLHLRSLPVDHFRGYNEEKYARTPEDVGRPTVISRGIEFHGCENVRFDHCEVELFGHAGVIFYGGTDNLVDHCFFHENFRYGYGYGVATPGTKKLYIEDNNFENHRHGIAGNARGASYIARYNRLVKDSKTVPTTGWNQLASHEIDAHSGCSWIYAHDNYVAMKNGRMTSAAGMRGNPGWLYRNLIVGTNRGILCSGKSDDVWTWDNEFIDVSEPNKSTATGAIHFDEKPPNFQEIPYPHKMNRLGTWPGAKSDDGYAPDRDTSCAGPQEPQLLRRVVDETE